ncbi:lipase [Amycolatopsis orientalis]|uniref:Lipase n=1 Tax=Amycolatopsis orientalis TaxID=31958 RepID=A0A193C7S5_AMYOR|nr:alpha/beta fold hydrolase [Amycolatopsis orientalis]ANN20656.1 lipase [Amycolatopsis orientalis]
MRVRVTNGGATKTRRILSTVIAALTFTIAAPAVAGAATTSGWNDWSCRPGSAHPEPVVLVHGLGGNATTNWFSHAPKLKDAGYCVYSLTYGATVLGGQLFGGLASMRKSAVELDAFVDRVRSSTGAVKVDIVGHSEGTTMPAYYLKFGGGAEKVKHFVGFGSNFKGTSLNGLSELARAVLSLPGIDLLADGVCGACREYLAPSDFLDDLARGGVSVPGPTYTSIVSRHDRVVTPYTSGVLGEPGTTDIVLQDRCATDVSGHLSQAIDPNVTSLILKALDPVNAPAPTCVPFFAPL